MNIITEAELPDDIGQLKLMVKSFEWKTIQEQESLAYERRKASHSRNVEQLRLMELDNQISGRKKFVPKNILKLRASVVEMERQQENQRRFLSFLTHFQQLNEHLISATQQNDGAQVMQLLQQGADVNYVDSVGYLPLHYAVIYGHYDLCQLLLLKGADFSTFLTGHSSVVFACQYGHVSILSLLLSFGADVGEKDRSGVSPVMMALTHLHFHVMEFCIMNGADVHDYDLSTENTLLHTLILTSSHPAVPTTSHPLLSLHTRRPVTAPALSLPDTSSSNEVVVAQIFDFLVCHGVDLYKLNKQHVTPLQLALQLQNRHCIDLLKPHYSHSLDTPLHPSGGEEVDKGVAATSARRKSEVENEEGKGEARRGRRHTATSAAVSLQKVRREGGDRGSGRGCAERGEQLSEGVAEGGGDDRINDNEDDRSIVRPRLSRMTSDDNLAIPPPSATVTTSMTSWSSMNLLEKINENFDKREKKEEVVGVVTTNTQTRTEVEVVGVERRTQSLSLSPIHPSDMISVASSVTFD